MPNSQTHCKMTILSPMCDPDVVNHFPLHHLPPNSEARVGFERGVLERAVFELESGTTLIYEAIEERN